mmetsp:Transcript_25829/g.54949  ORF Transcript_25829/g.54949 Transcript_25829/m.54949 type:complete len:314 (+) Transcript_25829:296-1237(+)
MVRRAFLVFLAVHLGFRVARSFLLLRRLRRLPLAARLWHIRRHRIRLEYRHASLQIARGHRLPGPQSLRGGRIIRGRRDVRVIRRQSRFQIARRHAGRDCPRGPSSLAPLARIRSPLRRSRLFRRTVPFLFRLRSVIRGPSHVSLSVRTPRLRRILLDGGGRRGRRFLRLVLPLPLLLPVASDDGFRALLLRVRPRRQIRSGHILLHSHLQVPPGLLGRERPPLGDGRGALPPRRRRNAVGLRDAGHLDVLGHTISQPRASSPSSIRLHLLGMGTLPSPRGRRRRRGGLLRRLVGKHCHALLQARQFLLSLRP